MLIDFDPTVEDVLMPADLAMKFMVWAAYFNDIELEKGKSFSRLEGFSRADAERLDRLQDVLFRCFEPESVSAAIRSLKQARKNAEPCPFTEYSLNALFGERNN